MIEAWSESACDVECPHCGALLIVEDSEDFDENTAMSREEDHEMLCPVCGEYMAVHVTWYPAYLHGAKAVAE